MNEAVEQKAVLHRTTIGFWLYLMTDCALFASLFATYVVLHGSTAGGPGSRQLFELPTALTETLVLLISSYACGMAVLAMRRKNVRQVLIALAVTAVLGVTFLAIELREFITFSLDGAGWQRSAFLSAFFTLVGTHGLHILTGLIWLTVTVVTLLRVGLTDKVARQLTLFSLFWHFLDLVWIFIFTVVYLMGVAA